MLRKWFCLVWAISMMAGAGISADAAGTIRIRPEWCSSPVSGGTVGICQVGTRTEKEIILSDDLANWHVREEELDTGDWISWLAQKELQGEIRCTVTEGEARFEDLPEGLYLVRQTVPDQDGREFEPFFLMIPEGENWDVFRAPKTISQEESPKTGDRPTPLVGAMGIGLSVAFLMVFVDEHRK